jgi:SAM-dependent methyltransferase
MRECSKSIARRLHDPGFSRHYFVGAGIDIGGRPDPLSLYVELFPLMEAVRVWDLEDGDAEKMPGVPDGSVDFVHSSHCLEHLDDPAAALARWLDLLRPGGHLIVTVPDEDLYEQGRFPSSWNQDHAWTFTIHKTSTWSDRSINVLDLLRTLGEEASPERIQLLSDTYRFSLPRYDQTLTPVAECGIEFIVRKRSPQEVSSGGRMPAAGQPDRETRLHLNQYVDDQATLRGANRERPPFRNDAPLPGSEGKAS